MSDIPPEKAVAGETAPAGSDWQSVLGGPAERVAPRLLGCELIRRLDGPQGAVVLRGRIVETEAYDQADAASHSYKGRTPRTEVMFGPAGFLYVYFTYGMHYCCNVVVGREGRGTGVLIRALEPLKGIGTMAENRYGWAAGGPSDPPEHSLTPRLTHGLTNGPAKLCQALAITKAQNGIDLRDGGPVGLDIRPPLPSTRIVRTTRIGIRQAADVQWRFYIQDNPYVSSPAQVSGI